MGWDAGNAAHAAFVGIRTVTAKNKAAWSHRYVCSRCVARLPYRPGALLGTLTRMQLTITLGAWRPDLSSYRQFASVYRITLKSLGRRYLALHDEKADLDLMIAASVDDLARELFSSVQVSSGKVTRHRLN